MVKKQKYVFLETSSLHLQRLLADLAASKCIPWHLPECNSLDEAALLFL